MILGSKKDPGIPNTFPMKAELIEQINEQKQQVVPLVCSFMTRALTSYVRCPRRRIFILARGREESSPGGEASRSKILGRACGKCGNARRGV